MKGFIIVLLLAALLVEVAIRLAVLLVCAVLILPLLMILFEGDLDPLLEPLTFDLIETLVDSL